MLSCNAFFVLDVELLSAIFDAAEAGIISNQVSREVRDCSVPNVSGKGLHNFVTKLRYNACRHEERIDSHGLYSSLESEASWNTHRRHVMFERGSKRLPSEDKTREANVTGKYGSGVCMRFSRWLKIAPRYYGLFGEYWIRRCVSEEDHQET